MRSIFKIYLQYFTCHINKATPRAIQNGDNLHPLKKLFIRLQHEQYAGASLLKCGQQPNVCVFEPNKINVQKRENENDNAEERDRENGTTNEERKRKREKNESLKKSVHL